MVKVVELTREEIAERDRFSKLTKIAQETLPNYTVDCTSIGIGISPHSDRLIDRIHITPHNNRILAYSMKSYPDAMKLARAYESSGESNLQ